MISTMILKMKTLIWIMICNRLTVDMSALNAAKTTTEEDNAADDSTEDDLCGQHEDTSEDAEAKDNPDTSEDTDEDNGDERINRDLLNLLQRHFCIQ